MVSINLGLQFMLYADFETSPKTVNETFEKEMKQGKAEQKAEAPHAEKIKTQVSSGYCGWSTLLMQMFLIH